MKKTRIAVIGGGSWGTAIIKLLLQNVDNVSWWVRQEATVDYIHQYRKNPGYLRYLELDTDKLDISTNLQEVINKADFLIFAIPAAFLKKTLENANIKDFNNKVIVSAIKGIIPEDNLIVSDFFNKYYNVDLYNIGAICGPCHSEEVAMEKLSFLTLAFKDLKKADFLMENISGHFMRISSTTDIIGAEYAAVLKNIIAIANGICIGLGYGDNFQSVLIVNAMREVKRFLEKIDNKERDINNSVYLGDLVVTSYSKFSRNRTFGNMIGKGYSVKYAKIEMKMIAEGFYAVKCIHEINEKLNVYLPITESVFNIIYEGIAPFMEMKILSEKLN